MHEFAFRFRMLAEEMEETAEDPSAFASGAQSLLFALGLLLMISLMTRVMIRAYQRSRRRSPRKDVKRVRNAADKQAARTDTPLIDAPAGYGRWHAEMNDIARAVEAEVETKIGRLQATIRLADETALRLEQAIQNARGLIRSNEETADTKPVDHAPDDSEAQRDSLEQSEEVLSSLQELAQQTHRLIPKPHVESQRAIESQVITMAGENATAREIADSIGLPIGDVELILSTRSQRNEM